MQSYESLTHLLKKHFGHEHFRSEQQPLVELIHSGTNVLGILPTGKGKSACFQVPALVKPGITVVITPLVALMHDQVRGLKEKGIAAETITGNTPYSHRDAIFESIKQKQTKLLYISPELFCRADFAGKFGRDAMISAIVFDEAHCLSLWGDDFRPAYMRAAQMAQVLSKRYEQAGMPPIQLVALTATATNKIEAQLCQTLNIRPQNVYKTDLSRPNLRLKVSTAGTSTERTEKLITMVKHYSASKHPVLIYTNTRNSVESLAQTLRMVKVNAAGFHAGMPAEVKNQVQEDFLNDRIDVVVATVAFGMGIDKSNIRAVIHYRAPRSIEDYYQQIGRAGRDGYPASCHLLFDYDSEYANAIEMLNGTTPSAEHLRKGYDFMLALYQSDGTAATVYPDVMAGAINVSKAKAETILEQLEKFAVTRKLAPNRYQVRQLEDYSVLEAVDSLNKAKLDKVKSMMAYGNTQECKQNIILNYFGQHPEHSCGQCSYCKAPQTQADQSLASDGAETNRRFRTALVALRTEIAKSMRVPPFTVMSDKCINLIVERQPMDVEGLKDTGMKSMHAFMHVTKIREVVSQFATQPEQAPVERNDSRADNDTFQRPDR